MKASHVLGLERLYRRFVPPEQVVTPELAHHLTELSQEIRRQVGIIVDRRGSIEYVIVGDSQSLFIPELGRIRAGAGRLRAIRLIHTHLKGEPLATDDLNDLCLLSLDMVAVLDGRAHINPLPITYAHLLPVNSEGKQWEVTGPVPVHDVDMNFGEFIHDLEAQFSYESRGLKAGRGKERAVLVHLDDGRRPDAAWEVEELEELADSAGLEVVEVFRQRRQPDSRYFIGKGKLTDILIKTMQREVDLLVFCPDLSPAQVKAIGDMADIRVMDRTQLILDIFAQRAHSKDGKVQVELAQLRYLAPRLLGAGKVMSRLMGGIGGRGPGETKLETDRRRVKQRITALEQQLVVLGGQRKERRKRRERAAVPIVAIVGYTNAGKSTLLNTLTHARAVAEDKLFATLDPFSKRLRFPEDREVILTDTVGFIRDLPADLKAAFRATLEELEAADLLLHVVDASNPRAEEQLKAVEQLLDELNLGFIDRITVFNKMDRLSDPQVALNWAECYSGVGISALRRESLRPLVERIEQRVWAYERTPNPCSVRGELDEEKLRP